MVHLSPGKLLFSAAVLLTAVCAVLASEETGRQLLVKPRQKGGRRPHDSQTAAGERSDGQASGSNQGQMASSQAAAAEYVQQSQGGSADTGTGSFDAGTGQAGGVGSSQQQPEKYHISGWDGQPSWEWDNPRTLYFEPIAGLGNRLRALASAVAVAREAGVGLKVVWREEVDCREDCGHMPPFNSTWPDLFSYPKLRLADNFPGSNYSVHKENVWLAVDNHIINPGMPPVIAGFNCNVHYAQNHSHLMDLIANNFTHVHGEQVLCVKSDLWLTTNGEGNGRFFFKLLQPSEPVRRMLEEYKKTTAWDEFHMIGVHIRRTDLALTDANGKKQRMDNLLSLSKYVDTMRKLANLASSSSGLRFFVATDDAEAEKIVKSSFEAGTVFSYPKTAWKRSSVEGIQQALVDVLLLADCPVLIGTYYSSYSETAKLIGWPFYIQLGGEFNSLSKETEFKKTQ